VLQWLPTEDLPIGQEPTTTSSLFSQDKKANGKCVKALQALCTLWLPWKTKKTTTNIWSHVFHKY